MLDGLRRRVTYANVMATIAVFAVLAGGGAYAASKIGPNEIKKNAVRAKHIKRSAVRSKQIKNRGIALRDIGSGTRNALRGRRGAVTLDQALFHPLNSATDHERDSARGRFCNVGFPWFEAVFEGLPDGATLTGFEFFSFDSSSGENLIGLAKRTTPQATTGPLQTILATYNSSGSGGFQSASDTVDPGQAEIDGDSTYSVMFRLDGQESASCSEGNGLQIVGARAAWVRE